MSHNCKEHSCSTKGSSSLRQTLDEMDFERGIWFAAQQNDTERLDYLLKKGSCADKEDLAGYTALHYAARNGHFLVCEKLLKNGANVNAKTRSGQATALHRAASQGHFDIVELLLKAKADPNVRDADGFTPLHRAIKANAVNVCQILISRTNLQAADNRGLTYFQFASQMGNKEIADFLQERN